MFFVSGPEDCQAHAYTYAGERTDRRLIFPSCTEACQGPVIAPDGSVPSPSDRPSALGIRIWATDSRNVCGFPDGDVHPIRVGWHDLRTLQNLHVTTFPRLFDQSPMSRYALVACDVEAGTAVLTAENTNTGVDAVAIVSLARAKVLWHQEFPTGTGPVSVVAAPDGRYLAVQHTYQPPLPTDIPTPVSCPPGTRTPCKVPLPPARQSPTPTEADLYALHPTPHIVGRITGQGIVGWSGDGSRLITWNSHGPTGTGDVVRVLRAEDGQAIWQITASYNSAVSAPGFSAIAIQTYSPDHKTAIHLIDAAGQARHLNVTGQLIPSR